MEVARADSQVITALKQAEGDMLASIRAYFDAVQLYGNAEAVYRTKKGTVSQRLKREGTAVGLIDNLVNAECAAEKKEVIICNGKVKQMQYFINYYENIINNTKKFGDGLNAYIEKAETPF